MSDITVSTTMGGYGIALNRYLPQVDPYRGPFPALTITNSGAVLSAGTYAISANPIYARYGIQAGLIVWDITNYGKAIITQSSHYAVSVYGLQTLNNFGTISGGGGVIAGPGDLLSNAGTIIGTAMDGVNTGVRTLENSGIISGAIAGITGSGTIINTGLITGGSYGVDLPVVNTLLAQNLNFTYGHNVFPYPTVAAVLDNAGTITSGRTGLLEYSGTVANYGVLYGGIAGVSLAGGILLNAGFVSGGLTGVIDAGATGLPAGDSFVSSVAGSFVNTGTITGGLVGVEVTSQGVPFYNAGTIAGAQYAVYVDSLPGFGLTVAPGADFSGAVRDAAGTGTLVLAGTGAGSIDIASFSGFSNLIFSTGTDWALEGAAAQLAGGQKIYGFQPGNALILDGFAATAESFVSGTGLVLSNGTTHETLALVTQFPGETFAFGTSGGKTTITAEGPTHGLVSTISTAFSGEVTPGSGNYAADMLITGTGSVINPGTAISGFGTLINDGLISGFVSLTATAGLGNFINAGTVAGNVSLLAADLQNSGAITAGVTIDAGALTNTGSIGGTVSMFTGTLYNSGIIAGAVNIQSGLIDNTGSIAGVTLAVRETLVNAGTITAVSGRDAVYAIYSLSVTALPGADFAGTVFSRSFDSHLTLAGTGVGSLDMGTSFSGFSSIDFAPGVDWTLEGDAAELAQGQSITSFTAGDTIVLDGFAATGKVYAGGAKLVLTKTGATETLGIIGSFSTSDFIVTDNAQGGTDISVLCYLHGTQLLAPDGPRAIETLRIGDPLVTRFGGVRQIKWIGRQAFSPAFAGDHKTPVRIQAGALGGGLPLRGLLVSPGHSVLLGERLVLARNLINGVTITQPPAEDMIDYFLVEFESHDCVLAEGVWAESFADGPGLRAQFHNAAAFYALYPDHVTPEALQLCAPRPESGPELAAALSPVVERASAGHEAGKLRGYIDVIGPDRVEGWALDETQPNLPVALHVLDGEILLGTVLACDYRADLAQLSFGRGYCHFNFPLPRPLQNQVHVRRAGDGTEIFPTSDCRRAA